MASLRAVVAFVVLHLLCVHHHYSLALSSSEISFYADNGLDQTIAYKYLPSRERTEMQQEILSLLGLHHRPKPKTHGTDNSAPKYLIDLYKSFLDEESGNLKINEAHGPVVIEGEVLSNNSLHAINDSDIIMSFVNQIHHHAPHLRHDKDRRFWFDVSEVTPQEDIMDAELRLYRDLSLNTLPSNLTFHLTLYSLSQGEDPEDKVLNYVESVNISNDEGWIMFNVTDPIITWVAFPHHNLGLYLRIRSHEIDRDIDPHEIGIIGSKGSRDRQTFMIAYLKSSSYVNVRRTRSARKRQRSDVSYYDHDEWNPYLNPHDRYASGRSCQKRTLYISFRDLGWQDWIIAPDGYAAFFCDGECSFPLNAHMNATNHAIVQTLVHLMNPYNVPKPCCAPNKLSAIMVLYFDDNSNVILKKYKNMVVKSCGCH